MGRAYDAIMAMAVARDDAVPRMLLGPRAGAGKPWVKRQPWAEHRARGCYRLAAELGRTWAALP